MIQQFKLKQDMILVDVTDTESHSCKHFVPVFEVAAGDATIQSYGSL